MRMLYHNIVLYIKQNISNYLAKCLNLNFISLPPKETPSFIRYSGYYSTKSRSIPFRTEVSPSFWNDPGWSKWAFSKLTPLPLKVNAHLMTSQPMHRYHSGTHFSPEQLKKNQLKLLFKLQFNLTYAPDYIAHSLRHSIKCIVTHT